MAASSLVSHERLTCPYQGDLLQFGTPRTASTLQWYTLCTIQRACALLNVPNKNVSVHVDCTNSNAYVRQGSDSGIVLRVLKTHGASFARAAVKKPGVRIFETCNEVQRGLHYPTCHNMSQQYEINRAVMVRQPYALAQRWGLHGTLFAQMQPLFALPEAVTQAVHAHMKYWSILRQCCGSQQSQDHRLELHGIAQNDQAHPHHPQGSYDDPDCEEYRLEVVERLFLGTWLARKFPTQLWLAANRTEERIRPGMCAQWEQRIRAGIDFNGKNWTHPSHVTRGAAAARRQTGAFST